MSISPLLGAEHAVLRDGGTVEIRATTAADLEALTQFHEGLSDESRRMRFLCAGVDVRKSVRLLLAPHIAGLVALAGSRIIGHGCLVPAGSGTAELAFAVADSWQHRGIATVLLERLVLEGGARGLTTLTAEVHPANRKMIRVFSDAGLPVTMHAGAGTLHVEMPAGASPEVLSRFEERHRRAAVAGLDHVLRPASVAVIGASDRPGSVGGALLRNVLAGGFRGQVHAVRPGGGRVAGLDALPRVSELPSGIDLAVVSVPAEAVGDVAQECAAAGVRSLVVLSAGFGEMGRMGQRRQERLLETCRTAGMRLVGPNCLGVITTDPAVRLSAIFAPQRVPAGGVALASQSGTVGIIAMDAAARRGIGLSNFVSLGNRADVSSNDLLRYWAEDPRTRVIALYLESFGNPRAFAAAAREVSAHKPIVAVKAGRSAAGGRAAASHTGALIEGSDALADALLREAGVTRVDTVGQLLDCAAVLDRAGAPRGPRLGIVTNAGGGGIACADAAEAAGLELPRLRRATRARIKELRPHGSLGNPVDLLADVSAEAFGEVLDVVAADPAIDAVAAIHVLPLAGEGDRTLETIADHAVKSQVPVVLVALAEDLPTGLTGTMPVLSTPEDAALALGRIAAGSRQGLPSPVPAAPPSRIDRAAGAAVVAEGLGRGEDWLSPDLAMRLARAYGIPLAAAAIATAVDDVAPAATRLGGAVAIKAIVRGITHKTEHGAVRVGLATPDQAAGAAAELSDHLRRDGFGVTGFLVQEMIAGGVEMLVGATNHPTFGPIVVCGAGGTTAELWNDVQVRLAPVSRATATEMVRGLRCAPLLRGWRGAPKARPGAVEDVVRRLGTMIADRPEIAEVECNPLLATPAGAVAVDLRVRVRAAAP